MATATALGLKAHGGEGADVAAVLRDQQRLIVLDNCEHVLSGVRALVGELDARCPGVRVLATSRERIGVTFEHVVALRPLSLAGDDTMPSSDAAQLFVERAGSALPAPGPSPDELSVVEEICTRLDGLPLAIELAAARLHAITLDELRVALADRFVALRGHRGARARHESLRTVIAWSYETLDKEAQRFMDELSVFVGSFDATAAAAVAGRATDVEALLDELVAKSLLVENRSGPVRRFEQLETIREFGADRLRARRAVGDSRRRHIEHFRAWGDRADAGIRGVDELAWHRAWLADWHNVRTAIDYACLDGDADEACALVRAIFWWGMARARFEIGEWAEAVRELPACADHPMRPIVTAAAAHFALLKGEDRRSAELFDAAIAEEARLGEAPEPWVPVITGFFVTDPTQLLHPPREVQRRGGDDLFWRVLGQQQECGVISLIVEFGDLSPDELDKRVTFVRDARKLADQLGNPNGIAFSAYTLGATLRQREPAEAMALFEEALRIATPLDIENTVAQARRELALLYVELGRPLDALQLIRPAIRHHLGTGATAELRSAIGSALRALVAIGRPEIAATMLGSMRTVAHSGIEQGSLIGLDERLDAHLPKDEQARLRAVGEQTDLMPAVESLLELIDGYL